MSHKASALDRLILRVRRRLFLQVFVAALLRTLAVALVVVAGWFLLQPLFETASEWKWSVAAAFLGIGVATALVLPVRRAPSKVNAALAVDDAFNLKERVTTYLTLPPEILQTSAGEALTADVHEKVASLELAGKFPLRVSLSAALLPACAAVFALVAFFIEPFGMSASTRANSVVRAATAKEIEQQLDKLKKTTFGRPDDKSEKSEEMKELEKAWDKLVKSPPPKTEEQIRERVKEMRSLEDKMKERIRDLAAKNDALKKIEKLGADLKKDGNRELNELTEALAKKQLDQAVAALDRLAKKLKNKELSQEERQKIAEQLQDLQEKLQRLAENKDQKDKLQREFDEGKITKEQLEREMERLAQQEKHFKALQELAELMGQCSKCMGKGDTAFLEKLEMLKGKLQTIELSEDELRALMQDQQRLEDFNETLLMALNECQGNCEGDLESLMNGMGKGSRPGTTRPIGEDPEGSKIVPARQHAENDPNGQQRITGFTKGGLFSRIPARDVGGAFKQAVQDAPEALERQRIPPDAADMAKGYFQKLGGQH